MNAFTHAEGVYTLTVSSGSITLTFSQVVRNKDGMTGTLRVGTTLTFVRTTHGAVLQGKLNLLSPTTIKQWVDILAGRFNTTKDDTTLPWGDWLHELSLHVSEALAQGPTPVNLAEVALPGPIAATDLPGGLVVLDRLPMIICGDGEVGKSTLALWMAGQLSDLGHTVLYADWETDEETVTTVLRRLYPQRPPVHYYHAKPYGAIWDQRDGLKAQIKVLGVTYLICDSVLLAIAGSDGVNADSAVARYFSEVGALGKIGSCHLAHVAKTVREDEGKSQKRVTAIGSVFWQNLARIGYFADSDDDGTTSTRTVALYRNKGGLLAKSRVRDIALDFHYDDTVPDGLGAITVTSASLIDNPTLSQRLGFGTRIYAFLRRDTHTTDEVAEHLYGDAEEKNLDKARAWLRKLEKAGKVVKLQSGVGGRGHTTRWGNAAYHSETGT